MFKDRLFVIGGQEGDFMAKPGSPIFKCSRRREVQSTTSIILFDILIYMKLCVPFMSQFISD